MTSVKNEGPSIYLHPQKLSFSQLYVILLYQLEKSTSCISLRALPLVLPHKTLVLTQLPNLSLRPTETKKASKLIEILSFVE